LASVPAPSEVRPPAARLTNERLRPGVTAGLFCVTASLLLLEVSLTRVLSVVMWYHFAFFAISVALFGLAAAGLCVYLLPNLFTRERLHTACFAAAAFEAVAIPLSYLLLADNPAYRFLTSAQGGAMGAGAWAAVALLYVVNVVPFFFGGLIGPALFRHYGQAAGRLYFYDLIGAGLGCLAAVPALDLVGGPGAIVLSAGLAGLGAVCFGATGDRPRQVWIGAVIAALALALVVADSQGHWLRLRYSRGRPQTGIQYEKWNSFSRVTVRNYGEPDTLLLEIDAASNTLIARWDGNPVSLAPLRDRLIAVQYALEPQPRVFVIGSGGGVDLLTAVAAGATSVTAVEVNPIIVGLLKSRYAGFSGGIYRRPEIHVVTDEARSQIRRSHEHYDVIQAGYVDTYAATAAGAFSLTENTLYTVEAYQDYLAHLTPDGIVSIQRYYEEPPQQSIRLVSLALEALRRRGDPDPARHVVVVREADRASVLVKNGPFTEDDVRRLEAQCARAGLELIAAPGRPGKGLYGEMLAAPDFHAVIARQALDLSPTTDDRPFFFYVVKPMTFWRALMPMTGERMNSRAVFLLTGLLFVSFVGCVLLVIIPALAGGARAEAARAIPAMGYFGALGLGFILVEIGALQRLMLFLGHPALALSVVLSTLLLSAGLGSRSVKDVPLERTEAALRTRLLLILLAVAVSAWVWPPLLRAWIALERPARVAVSVLALAPVGFLLGTAMPLGLKRLSAGRAALVPWAWSVNGGTSVLGSVLAMVVAINNGFTATLVVGGLCYVAALVLAPRTGATQETR
jgi:predicted membrane-bound spermidine synthase